MRVTTVVGARPQFIKASPVSRALRTAGIDEVLVHTGQHYDRGMSQVFFEELGLAAPDVNLGVGSGSHATQTAAMLVGIEQQLLHARPDMLVVYGDTNSTLAASLAAAKLHIPIAHVEAGLRSFNRRMPEETNRIVTDSLSELLFAPTAVAASHLHREGVPAEKIYVVGDVMYDAALLHGTRARETSDILGIMGLMPGSYVLATVHRAENTDDPARLRSIIDGLSGASLHHTIVWPMHPRTRATLDRLGWSAECERRLRITEPVGYLDMVMLEKSASVIATDSGGVQKEAFFHRVPCVTLREETEWVETVSMGWNTLVPPANGQAIASAIDRSVGCTGEEGFPYGDGRAAERIADAIRGWTSS
jgi:UDP-GlcNAc3NAcA epimerase